MIVKLGRPEIAKIKCMFVDNVSRVQILQMHSVQLGLLVVEFGRNRAFHTLAEEPFAVFFSQLQNNIQ